MCKALVLHHTVPPVYTHARVHAAHLHTHTDTHTRVHCVFLYTPKNTQVVQCKTNPTGQGNSRHESEFSLPCAPLRTTISGHTLRPMGPIQLHRWCLVLSVEQKVLYTCLH